jgi:predicted transcriptional regulator
MSKIKIKDRVTEYLKQINIGKTPTEIGIMIGKDYNTASSSVTTSLKSLVEEGFVERIKTDNKILYKWIRKSSKIITNEIRS